MNGGDAIDAVTAAGKLVARGGRWGRRAGVFAVAATMAGVLLLTLRLLDAGFSEQYAHGEGPAVQRGGEADARTRPTVATRSDPLLGNDDGPNSSNLQAENETEPKVRRGGESGTPEMAAAAFAGTLTGLPGHAGSAQPPISSPEDPPELPISGRVTSEWGDAVAGAGIVALAQRLYTADGASIAPPTATAQRTETDQQGFYLFPGLAAGEYQIRTEPTERFPSGHIRVRSGTRSADIVLPEGREVRIFGTVRDHVGGALAGALVQPRGQDADAFTDDSGGYALMLDTGRSGAGNVVDLSMPGYLDRQIAIQDSDLRGLDEFRVDAVLQPDTGGAEVYGRVAGDEGRSVEGALVRLSAPGSQRSYQVLTDQLGTFAISEVAVDDDYQLWINGGSAFKEHLEQPVVVSAAGLTLSVTLESVDGASLSGRMVDMSGRAIPWVGLWMRSGDSAASIGMINGDGAGAFHVDQLPAGSLMMQTQIPPYLSVSGISLAADRDTSVDLILDLGAYEISGQVTDHLDRPVPGAEIAAAWSHQSGELVSRSSRRTTSSVDGSFRFSGLGPGIHTLSIQAQGYRGALVQQDPAGEEMNISVALTPAEP